jgi:hypothetical protein
MSEVGETVRPRFARLRQKLFKLKQSLRNSVIAQVGDITFHFERAFEVRGVDVALWVSAKDAKRNLETKLWIGRASKYGDRERDIMIELKSVIGDDYPAVLRQMKANGSSVLFVGEYTGQGASEEQFVKTIATAGIRVLFAREV